MARLRQHARAPEWALAQSAQELADADGADKEALDEENPDGDLPPDEGAELDQEDAEPARPLPTVSGSLPATPIQSRRFTARSRAGRCSASSAQKE